MSLDGLERFDPTRATPEQLRREHQRMFRVPFRPPPIGPESRIRRWLRVLTGNRTGSTGAR
jgi:hypothetical protein